jgi:hypothetical protein
VDISNFFEQRNDLTLSDLLRQITNENGTPINLVLPEILFVGVVAAHIASLQIQGFHSVHSVVAESLQLQVSPGGKRTPLAAYLNHISVSVKHRKLDNDRGRRQLQLFCQLQAEVLALVEGAVFQHKLSNLANRDLGPIAALVYDESS